MIRRIRRQVLAAALLVAAGAGGACAQEYVELLDPQLSRWDSVDAQPGTFEWADDALRVTGPNGWLRSDRQYSDFDLHVEFRFLTDAADSGIFFRAIGNDAFLRGWPNEAYQLQMRNPVLESRFPPLGGLFRHGMPDAATDFDEALAHEVTLGTGEWQTLQISVRGEQVTAAINDVVVVSGSGIGNDPGYLGIQGEAPALELRSVRIIER